MLTRVIIKFRPVERVASVQVRARLESAAAGSWCRKTKGKLGVPSLEYLRAGRVWQRRRAAPLDPDSKPVRVAICNQSMSQDTVLGADCLAGV